MKTGRTDRRELKARVARLEAENARLREQLARVPSAAPEAEADEEFVPLLRCGYPVRVSPLKARDLKEAKKIFTLSDNG